MRSQKPHVVCIPMTLQGHINAMIKLANMLHSRGFYITLVLSEHNFVRLTSSLGEDFLSIRSLQDFRIETIPDGLPSDSNRGLADSPELVLFLLTDETKKTYRSLLMKLLNAPDIPPISYTISDIFMFFAIEVGKELGIPVLSFATISACGMLGLMPYDEELIKRGYFHSKDCEFYLTNDYLDKPFDWVPGLSKWAKVKDILAYVSTTNPDEKIFNYFYETARNFSLAKGVICNTFDDLESEALKAINAKVPKLYTIGPLTLLCKELHGQNKLPLTLSLWKEDNDCFKWLNNRSPKSVTYVNFGSLAVLTTDQLMEFAWGLANSGNPFLWVVRTDLAEGVSSIITDEYMKEIEGRGLISSWCPQEKVLQHPSVAVFFTHCGWNSTLESICKGVPMICWPCFADQPLNCVYSCQEWKIAFEMEEGEVKRGKVEDLVKEMIEGERGKELQINALEWKKKSEEATRYGGSSYNNFDKLVNHLMEKKFYSQSP